MDTDTTTPETPPDPTSPPGGSGLPSGEPETPGRGRLHRCRRTGLVAGVAAGIADYLDLDPTVVRLGFVGLALLGGLAVPLYLAGWLLIPDEEATSSVLEDLLSGDPGRRRIC